MIDDLLEIARKRGVQAEVFLNKVQSNSIRIAAGKIDSQRSSFSQGASIRVIQDGKLGFAYTSQITMSSLQEAFEMAMRNSKWNTPDHFQMFPESVASTGLNTSFCDPRFSRTTTDEKVSGIMSALSVVKSAHQDVVGVQRFVYGDTQETVEIANSTGLHRAYETTTSYAWMETLARRNADSQAGFSFGYGRSLYEIAFAELGHESAMRALELLGGRSLPSQKLTIVFDPFASVTLLKLFTHMFHADSMASGKSLFADQFGEKIASPLFSLLDDGLVYEGLNSRPFDDEGIPTQRTALIEQGHLVGKLHNYYTAKKEGVMPTGNGKRDGIRSTPEIGANNLLISPGEKSQQKLLQEVGNGLLVTQIHGAHSINPLNGTFSVGLSGRLIANGELTVAVKEVTVAGELKNFFQHIAMVGNDLRWVPGIDVIGSPSLVFEGMTLSGN